MRTSRVPANRKRIDFIVAGLQHSDYGKELRWITERPREKQTSAISRELEVADDKQAKKFDFALF